MKYLTPGRYDDKVVEIAEALFDRFVGRSLAREQYTETCRLINGLGYLSKVPIISIESIEATVESSLVVPWTLSSYVSPIYLNRDNGVFVLPRSMFGEQFTTARVTYVAGYDPVPPDVSKCVEEIATLVQEGLMDEWSSPSALSDEAQAIIAKYRR